jgi:tetratricopeptide (TPR) repeat protein
MKASSRILAGSTVLVALLATTGCAKLRARDQLVKGVQNFKAGHYEEAVNNFQTSVELDPTYKTAHLYLATSYSYQVMADDDSASNKALAEKALGGFNDVLAEDPHDLGALRQEASIYRKIKDYDKAQELEKRVIAEDPNDSEAYYTIGVINWTQAYKNTTATIGGEKLTDDAQGNVKLSKASCLALQAKNGPLVQTAMDNLQKAVDINPNYDDAMSYLNLDYRQKATIECGNDAARKDDLSKADDWSQRSLGARKINEAAKEKKYGGGVSMQTNPDSN